MKLRTAGIAMFTSGTVMMFALGLPCLVSMNDGAAAAGAAFMAIGGATMTAGIPVLTLGCIRTKKAQKMDITMNASSNGIGLGLTF